MGNVFHIQNQIDLVGSFYDKVVTILKNTLKPGSIKLDDAQVAEAINMLQTIFSFRVNYSKGAISTGEVDYVFALLYRSCSDILNAKEHISRALTGKPINLFLTKSFRVCIRSRTYSDY